MENNMENDNDYLKEMPNEGTLAIDVFQTDKALIIQSPIAGVEKNDLDIYLEDDILIIRGERKREDIEEEIKDKDFFTQECYWGQFSRSLRLPLDNLDTDNISASMKNGILTISIPKIEKVKSKKIQIGD
jgi:HSP20 family protein